MKALLNFLKMNKLKIIVGLMVLAMLGLIVFQWFWLQNARQTRKMQFDWQVNDALQATIRKIEKQEIVLLANQRMRLNEQQKLKKISEKKYPRNATKNDVTNWVNTKQSISVLDTFRVERPLNDILIFESYDPLLDIQTLFIQDMAKQQHFYDYEFDKIEALRQSKIVRYEGITAEIKEQMNPKLDSTHTYTRIKEKKKKEDVVKNTVEQVIIGKRALYERLDRLMLDTLLKQEFLNRGIAIPYHYGVKDAASMVFSSFAVNYNSAILDKAYKMPLFPNDAVAQNQFLYVLFPDKENFIFQNMWGLFLSSALLILMIGSVFYQSSATMFRQKKLADVKNDFINNMTHEFKTPIATISLATQVLKDNTVQKDDAKRGRYLGIIEDENSRLGKHVEKVLQMALLDRGEIQLNLAPINIHEVIEKVLQNLSVQLEQHHVDLLLNLEANQDEIMADELHLTNIIYNLLDNAIKYSPESPKIEVHTQNINNTLVLSIKDQGIGMTKEQISKIFDKFYRVPTGNTHDIKGFGLGLSYVKKMLDAHKAQIVVESTIEQSSNFQITFG
jgi:two-component system, OmpR family, phosphate regulon sensor histidine kinase PhoR